MWEVYKCRRILSACRGPKSGVDVLLTPSSSRLDACLEWHSFGCVKSRTSRSKWMVRPDKYVLISPVRLALGCE